MKSPFKMKNSEKSVSLPLTPTPNFLGRRRGRRRCTGRGIFHLIVHQALRLGRRRLDIDVAKGKNCLATSKPLHLHQGVDVEV